MITYHVGDATEPDIDGRLVIAHVLSDAGAFGAGFAKALGDRYPRAKLQYLAWHRGERDAYLKPFRLGAIQWVGVGRETSRSAAWYDRWVVNMVAMSGLRSPTNPRPLNLQALHVCLSTLAKEIRDDPVVMPRIGCGLAGGDWDEVESVIEETMARVDVHVYDLPGTDRA
jgi:O-acetyl-ADP-ribose deacetylase (regulator of RNase III)